jgi:hypothetical protein
LENPFVVKDVEVYAESDSLDNANREAVNEGTKEAFDILLRRLMPSPMHWKIDNIKKDGIYDLVEDRETSKERMTARSYMGTISFTFSENEVKNLLNRMGANYAEKYGIKTLVVPVLKMGGEYTLWGENDWSSAWGQMPIDLGLSKFTYALGDLQDYDDIQPQTIMKKQYRDYVPVLNRYGADQLLFILAEELNTVFEVKLRLLSFKNDVTLWTIQDKAEAILDEDIYRSLGYAILTMFDDYYKGMNLFDQNRVFRTRMTVPVKSPKDWAAIRDKLFEMKSVSSVDVMRTKNDYVEIDLVYNIEPLKMTKILSENFFEVSDSENGQILKYKKVK